MMDTKEALKELEDLTVDYGNRNEEQIARLDEAIDMAMDALRNLPNRLRQATDTISRQSAIDAIVAQTIGYTVDEIKAECDENIFKENGYLGGLKDAINAIEDMPSAQPEKHTGKHTETHACDCIERKAAIDSLHGYFDGMLETDTWSPCDVYGLIEILPSAQPEIIRCKGCKHQVKEWRTDKRLKDKGYMVCGCEVVCDACGFWALLGQDDDYCSHAERKTDEQT